MMDMEESARADELSGDLTVGSETPPEGYGVTTTAPPTRNRRWLIPALAAALVVSLAVAAVFGTLYLTADVSADEVGTILSDESPQVEEIAGRVANLLMNYDSTNLEEVSDQMLSIATGNFREQYEEVLTSGTGLGSALQESSASSRGQITSGPDVYFQSGSEAVALLETTQFTQSNSDPGGSSHIYMLKITLIKTSNEEWKADRVEVLSAREG